MQCLLTWHPRTYVVLTYLANMITGLWSGNIGFPTCGDKSRKAALKEGSHATLWNFHHRHLSTSTHHFFFNPRSYPKLSFSHLGLVLRISHSSQRMAEDFDFDVRWLGSPWGYWDNREEAEKSEITQIEPATDQLSDLQTSAMREMQERRLEQYLSLFNVQKQWTKVEKRSKNQNFTEGNHPKIWKNFHTSECSKLCWLRLHPSQNHLHIDWKWKVVFM